MWHDSKRKTGKGDLRSAQLSSLDGHRTQETGFIFSCFVLAKQGLPAYLHHPQEGSDPTGLGDGLSLL